MVEESEDTDRDWTVGVISKVLDDTLEYTLFYR